jgi:hypothetical protein
MSIRFVKFKRNNDVVYVDPFKVSAVTSWYAKPDKSCIYIVGIKGGVQVDLGASDVVDKLVEGTM